MATIYGSNNIMRLMGGCSELRLILAIMPQADPKGIWTVTIIINKIIYKALVFCRQSCTQSHN